MLHSLTKIRLYLCRAVKSISLRKMHFSNNVSGTNHLPSMRLSSEKPVIKFKVLYILSYAYNTTLLSCCAYASARLGSLVVIHSFCLSVCLLPWHSSLSVHYFHITFSRAIKLARPFKLAKVVSYC